MMRNQHCQYLRAMFSEALLSCGWQLGAAAGMHVLGRCFAGTFWMQVQTMLLLLCFSFCNARK